MKKILVTGADGFIGSHLTEQLMEAGYEVKAFTFYNSFNRWGWLDTFPKDKLKEIEVFAGDIRDPNGVREAMKGVDAVFHPEPAEMYPQGFTTYVMVDGTKTDKLCGASRPGHFRGVATVVTKLIHITEADQVFFGQKDAQQVVVIKQFVQDLNLNVVIQMVPIVRDQAGLALSSRNAYLSDIEKKAAYILSASLKKTEKLYLAGEKNVEALKKLTVASIMSEPLAKIDYVDLYSFPALQEIKIVDQPVLLAVAVQFGKTRLIDNIVFGG